MGAQVLRLRDPSNYIDEVLACRVLGMDPSELRKCEFRCFKDEEGWHYHGEDVTRYRQEWFINATPEEIETAFQRILSPKVRRSLRMWASRRPRRYLTEPAVPMKRASVHLLSKHRSQSE